MIDLVGLIGMICLIRMISLIGMRMIRLICLICWKRGPFKTIVQIMNEARCWSTNATDRIAQ